MKHEQLQKVLKTMNNPPVYQCPHCQTVWFIVGGQSLRSYTCETCELTFIPAKSRYADAQKKIEVGFQLPQAA